MPANALQLDARALRPPLWTAVPRSLGAPALAIVLAALLYFFVQPNIGGYTANLMLFAGINVVLAVSLTIVNGFAGQFSIGHAGFMALGGYLAAAILYYGSFKIWGDANFHGGILSYTGVGSYSGPLLTGGDLLFIGACIAGGLLAAAVGWIVGLPSLRLRGDYLAIVTLGFGEIVRVVLQGTAQQYGWSDADEIRRTSFPRLFGNLGGALGFIGVPTYTTMFWVWTAVFLTLIAATRLKLSSYGRALLTVREDEIAAQAMGVNLTKYKVRAFVLAAFFAGVAGALYAMQIGSINAGELAFQKSFDIVIMVVLGGMGSISGAALAAIILTLLPELLRDPPSIWPWGLVIAAVLAGLIMMHSQHKLRALIWLAGACLIWEAIRWVAVYFGVNLAEYRMIIYALALIIMMITRPQGLFGVTEIWEFWPFTALRRLIRGGHA